MEGGSCCLQRQAAHSLRCRHLRAAAVVCLHRLSGRHVECGQGGQLHPYASVALDRGGPRGGGHCADCVFRMQAIDLHPCAPQQLASPARTVRHSRRPASLLASVRGTLAVASKRGVPPLFIAHPDIIAAVVLGYPSISVPRWLRQPQLGINVPERLRWCDDRGTVGGRARCVRRR